jgi:hypothetical protein
MTKLTGMTEAERAAYYPAHKDDPDLWGNPVPPPTPRGRPGRHLEYKVSVRFSAEESEILHRHARANEEKLSETIRRAVRGLEG